jgi:hypothetical protein
MAAMDSLSPAKVWPVPRAWAPGISHGDQGLGLKLDWAAASGCHGHGGTVAKAW